MPPKGWRRLFKRNLSTRLAFAGFGDMFFNIDADEGHAVRGWMVLDNPAAIPSITVIAPGHPEIKLVANVLRPDIQELGIHATGEVGFEVNETILPGIGSIAELEIIETESRLPIFRRFKDRHIEKRLYLFDAGVLPQRPLLQLLGNNFTMNYLHTERYSLETMLVIINNKFTQSSFMYGRSNFNRYTSFLANAGFLRAGLLREPFEEFAERLMFLKILGRSSASDLAALNATGLESLIGFASGLPIDDPKGVLAAFRALDREQRQILSNPMTRLFGCNFDEYPERKHVAVALENLATMDVVGTKARFEDFRTLLAGTLGRDVLGEQRPHHFGPAVEFGATLSKIGIVADMLENDIELYSFADQAIQAALEGSGGALARDTHSI